MTAKAELLQSIQDLVSTAYNDQMTAVAVADQAQMNQQIQRIIDENQNKANYEYRKCNPDYEPVKQDEMGDVNIISGNIVGQDEILEKLVSEATTKGDKNGTKPQKPINPEPRPAPIDSPQPQLPLTQQIAKWLTIGIVPAALAAGATYYLTKSDPQDDYVNAPGIIVTTPENGK